MSLKTADLCDKYHHELDIPDISFKSYGGKKSFFGPITTVKIYDNYTDIFMEAIENVDPGSVIVLDGVLSKPCAWMGDRRAEAAVSRGIAGVIINGLVRDVEGLSQLDLGILALGSHPLSYRFRMKKDNYGYRNVILDFGGIDWTPGHYVYSDEDGVVVSHHLLESVI